MPALAERTKIRTGNIHVPTTTGLVLQGVGFPDPYILSARINEAMIDTNVYLISAGSTRVESLQNVPILSPKAREILRRIYNYKDLLDNWDGNGAIPPNEGVINNAAFFLTNMDELDLPIYFTAPGPNGEIVLEYKFGDITAEVYFEEDSHSEMILYNGGDQVYSGQISISRIVQHFG